MTTILGLVGDTAHIDMSELQAQEIVERVTRVSEPYKKANRKFHPLTASSRWAAETIGEKTPGCDGGPCSVESHDQILEVARRVKASGANFLRGGAFKPRTSPYSFQDFPAPVSSCCSRQRRKPACPSLPSS
jgi:3-deoxy-7-phosphoheptulonate synthase